MPTTRQWVDRLLIQVFGSKQGFRSYLEDMELDEDEVNLDVKLRHVQTAIDNLEEKIRNQSREAKQNWQKYERLLDRIEDTPDGEDTRLRAQAYRVKKDAKRAEKLKEQLAARHQALVDIEMKIVDLGTRRQLDSELDSLRFDTDDLQELEHELEEAEQRRKDELEQAVGGVDRHVDGPDYTEIEADLGERQVADMEEGFGGLDGDLFTSSEEEELELEEG